MVFLSPKKRVSYHSEFNTYLSFLCQHTWTIYQADDIDEVAKTVEDLKHRVAAFEARAEHCKVSLTEEINVVKKLERQRDNKLRKLEQSNLAVSTRAN